MPRNTRNQLKIEHDSGRIRIQLDISQRLFTILLSALAAALGLPTLTACLRALGV